MKKEKTGMSVAKHIGEFSGKYGIVLIFVLPLQSRQSRSRYSFIRGTLPTCCARYQ